MSSSRSDELKQGANQLFGQGDYEAAARQYTEALAALRGPEPATATEEEEKGEEIKDETPAASLPQYGYARAVVLSNLAACSVQLSRWEMANEQASDGLVQLEAYEGWMRGDDDDDDDDDDEEKKKKKKKEKEKEERETKAEKESPSAVQINRIRCKLLLRRARARSETGGWAQLGAAKEDYERVLQLDSADAAAGAAVARGALARLQPRLHEAQQRETGEMMGKLKELGNGLLGHFGMSLDNFSMVPDQNGGYKMSMK